MTAAEMAGGKRHKVLMRGLYRYSPDIQKQLNLRKRVGRVGKFSIILNKRLKKGIVVDLGCGTGIYTKEIRSETMIGIDFSPEAVQLAKEYFPSGLFVLGDMEYLPFSEKTIDSFFSVCSVYCLLPESQYKCLKDIYGMLKEGGNVVLIEPNAGNPMKERGIKHPLNRNKVKAQLEKIGFKNVDVKFANFIPRVITRKGGHMLAIFSVCENFLELVQIPLSGSLVVYAEKPSIEEVDQ